MALHYQLKTVIYQEFTTTYALCIPVCTWSFFYAFCEENPDYPDCEGEGGPIIIHGLGDSDMISLTNISSSRDKSFL